jgi:hypothetical protein
MKSTLIDKSVLKAIDSRFDGRLRPLYTAFMTAVGFPRLCLTALRVKHRVGYALSWRIKRLKVVTFPNMLSPACSLQQGGYVMEKILVVTGIRPRPFTPSSKADLIINWQDLTENLISTPSYVEASYRYTQKGAANCWKDNLNFECVDISKTRIGQINRKVFGYDLDIDPTTYCGRAVSKSNNNATHDGRIVECPLSEDGREFDAVYNVLVDNTDGFFAVDFRLIYIKGLVPFFYEKKRPTASRFSNTNSSVALRRLEDEFSPDEISRIDQFCKELGAEYGELDVLRDANTRRIYVVDFAKTPAGPPNHLPKGLAAKAIEEMSVAFCKNVLAPLCAGAKVLTSTPEIPALSVPQSSSQHI